MKLLSNTTVLAATVWSLITVGKTLAGDLTATSLQPEFPLVTIQPQDQMVRAGSNITLNAEAENKDGYQWVKNGKLIEGATNGTLTIANAKIEDAGFYTCYAIKDTEVVPTRTASLFVATITAGEEMTVFGLPVVSGGSYGNCPGPYAGYVNFTKTVAQGWGWKPDSNTTVHAACDGVRSDTKIQYGGKYGDNACDQACVTLPETPMSTAYRFTIYFPNNVPTTNYPITLTGFLQ